METMIIYLSIRISCHPSSHSAHLDLDIPVIVVLGSQSAGKSSLIEAISGITLPRASGTCTRYLTCLLPSLTCISRTLSHTRRCPTECQLSHSTEPWRCVVSLRMVTDENGVDLDHPTESNLVIPFSISLLSQSGFAVPRVQS